MPRKPASPGAWVLQPHLVLHGQPALEPGQEQPAGERGQQRRHHPALGGAREPADLVTGDQARHAARSKRMEGGVGHQAGEQRLDVLAVVGRPGRRALAVGPAVESVDLGAAERAVGHQRAAVHDQDAVAGAAHLGQQMGGEHHRRALAEAPHQRAQLLALARVQPAAGLVEQHQRRSVHDRLRDAHALAVALGQRGDALARDVGQPALGDRLGGARGRLSLRHPAQPCGERQIGGHAHVVDHRRAVRQVADPCARAERVVGERAAADPDIACVRHQAARQHVERRGLAGPVQAQQPDALAAGNRKAEIAHRVGRGGAAPRGVAPARQAADVEQGIAGRSHERSGGGRGGAGVDRGGEV